MFAIFFFNGNPNRGNKDIKSGCYLASDKKRKITNDGRNRTTIWRKNQNTYSKGNGWVLGNIGSGHHQTSEDERKKHLWKVSQKKEKTTRKQTIQQKQHQRDKYLGYPPREMLGIILKVIEGRTSTNALGN